MDPGLRRGDEWKYNDSSSKYYYETAINRCMASSLTRYGVTILNQRSNSSMHDIMLRNFSFDPSI